MKGAESMIPHPLDPSETESLRMWRSLRSPIAPWGSPRTAHLTTATLVLWHRQQPSAKSGRPLSEERWWDSQDISTDQGS